MKDSTEETTKILAPKYKGIVGVCGASKISQEVYEKVLKLGKAIAEEGYAIACGGLYGTMEAICKGAKSASNGGFTIGIIPTKNKEIANDYVDLVIPTGIGEARNIILVSTAEKIVTISGGSGTLSEIAFAWRQNKPICAFKATGGWSKKLAGKRIDNTRKDKVHSATSIPEIIEFLKG